DFKNTIIIMTSNLGTKDLAKNIGFSNSSDSDNYEKMKSKVAEELKRYFKPEFLNRIDETIVFHELTLDEVKTIVDLMLERVHNQLKNSDLEIVLSDDAKGFLATEGYDREFGARPLRRSIQRLLEDPLSEELLLGKYKAGSTIVVSFNNETKSLEFESVEAPEETPLDFVDSES
ncbi:MAG: AAA family ATPase, partial [Candidatus Actinomarina sp.]